MSQQTKADSAVEACTNTALGFLGSYLITYLAMKQLALNTEALSLVIVVLCTFWSLVRGYWVRRFFNGRKV